MAAAVATLAMGLLANYPFALAPGMGLNAYFAYGVVGALGVPWQTALGAVFVSGVLFVALTVSRVRALIVGAIPAPLRSATAAGIGLFIAFLGLRNAGVVEPSEATLVTLGDVASAGTLLALAGLVSTGALVARKVRGAMFYPATVLFFAGLATAAILIFVIPSFAGFFESSNVPLPLPTRIVMGLSDFLLGFWWALAAGLAGLVWVLRAYRQSPSGRLTTDRLMLRVPILGDVLRKAAIARFSRTLGTLVWNGLAERRAAVGRFFLWPNHHPHLYHPTGRHAMLWDTLRFDVRHTCRLAGKTPLVTLLTVLALAPVYVISTTRHVPSRPGAGAALRLASTARESNTRIGPPLRGRDAPRGSGSIIAVEPIW